MTWPPVPPAAAVSPSPDTASASTRGSPHFHSVSTRPLATSRSSMRLFRPRTSRRVPHGKTANGWKCASGCGWESGIVTAGPSDGGSGGSGGRRPRRTSAPERRRRRERRGGSGGGGGGVSGSGSGGRSYTNTSRGPPANVRPFGPKTGQIS